MKWSKEAKRLHEHVKTHDLWKNGERLLIAYSGGLDSTVLCLLLQEIRSAWDLDLRLLHFNHGLRPGSDDIEDGRCREFASEQGLELFIEPLDVKGHPDIGKLGLEATARSLRYERLESRRRSLNCSRVLTAHHMDDQAETVLYALLRGSGWRGLAGIEEKGPFLVRPLLIFTREEIAGYCREKNCRHIEDESNSDTGFRRNMIRHRILPLLEENGFPDVPASLVRTSTALAELGAGLDYFTDLFLKENTAVSSNETSLDLSAFRSLPASLRIQILQAFLKIGEGGSHHISRSILERIIHFTGVSETGRSFCLPDGREVTLDRGNMILSGPPAGPWPSLRITGPGKYSLDSLGTLTVELKTMEPIFEKNREHRAYFPVEILDMELLVRNWQHGDRIADMRSGKERRVSDILTSAGLPVLKRRRWPVLTGDGEILWIPGVKRSGSRKLTAGKQRLIFLNFKID